MGFKLKALEPSESELELLIGHYLSFQKIFFWKTTATGFFDTATKRYRTQRNPYALKGVPDFCLVIDGKFYGWELKTKTGRQSDSQKIFEARLTKEGKAPYTLIRSLEEAKAELLKMGKVL